jgi:Pup amidohydrolase
MQSTSANWLNTGTFAFTPPDALEPATNPFFTFMAEKKYIGRDCELSTTGIDAEGRSLDSWDVTRAVLRQIDRAGSEAQTTVWARGESRRTTGSTYYESARSEDCLRHWTSAGMCFYADMAHVEICTAATLSPRTFAAQSIAALKLAEKARQMAEENSSSGDRYDLSASNADMVDPSVSFGSHISLSVSRALWENFFIDQRYPAVLGFVASAIAAAIAFFGGGYVLPLQNGRVIFSLSARAHHISKLHSFATTEKWRRGLLNSRREAHGTCLERLHLIGHDYSIAASALLASFLQCVLAAAEDGFCRLNLSDPVRAVHDWSWGLDAHSETLPATATLVDGRALTLPQYIGEVSMALLQMCETGLIDDEVAPDARVFLPPIIELAGYAGEGSLIRCASHLDWAAKFVYMRNMGGHFEDAAMRLADHDYANTNPEKGAIWKLWKHRLIDPLIDMDEAERAVRLAPSESRDWGRGSLIERFADNIRAVDWSYVELSDETERFNPLLRVEFPRLDSWNQSTFEPILAAVDVIGELRTALRQHERMVRFDDGHESDRSIISPQTDGREWHSNTLY